MTDLLPVQEALPVLTREERLRAAQWLQDNHPYFTADTSWGMGLTTGYLRAILTLRNG